MIAIKGFCDRMNDIKENENSPFLKKKDRDKMIFLNIYTPFNNDKKLLATDLYYRFSKDRDLAAGFIYDKSKTDNTGQIPNTKIYKIKMVSVNNVCVYIAWGYKSGNIILKGICGNDKEAIDTIQKQISTLENNNLF